MSREDRPHALLALMTTATTTSTTTFSERRGAARQHGSGGAEGRGRGRGEGASVPYSDETEVARGVERVVELPVPCGQSEAEPLGAFNNTSLHCFRPRI